MYAKLLGIVGLVTMLLLEGCVCFLPCQGRWAAMGLYPNDIVIQQKPAEEQKENNENPSEKKPSQSF